MAMLTSKAMMIMVSGLTKRFLKISAILVWDKKPQISKTSHF